MRRKDREMPREFAEQVADDVAMMFDGEIACVEPPADFFADNVFYRA